MKAWTQTSASPDAEDFKVRMVPEPRMRDHDVLVRVQGAAVNPVDVKFHKGYPGVVSEDQPVILGWDAVGVVEKVGKLSHNFIAGDYVWFAGSILRQGCFAELVSVDSRAASHAPRSLPPEIAAALPLTALTAYEGILDVARVAEKAGHDLTLLVVGGSGGVGSVLVQLAKHLFCFARVIATASRPETADFVKKLGADDVITHRKPLGPQLAALGITSGVDVVFNAAEADANWDAILADEKVLAQQGRMVCITEATKPIPPSALFRRLSIGFELMSARLETNTEPERVGEFLARLANWVDAGLISPRVNDGNVYSLKELPRALAMQATGRVIGKLVVKFDGWE